MVWRGGVRVTEEDGCGMRVEGGKADYLSYYLSCTLMLCPQVLAPEAVARNKSWGDTSNRLL